MSFYFININGNIPMQHAKKRSDNDFALPSFSEHIVCCRHDAI